MKKSSYVFYANNDNGYSVELVYDEVDKKCFVCGMGRHEVILDDFVITKEDVAEMRRNKAFKPIREFGNSKFNVFELVNLLNEIKAQTYSYGIKTEGKKEIPFIKN